ncbi:hypothetical protein KKE06_04085, partial [Candidatus Micrarchaeota archaeon]|nr:hypothetical protein [Candidatus Micrarchaeota archaeon]MBU1930685.1 hypothetical protein [Candidatus Micrarchaeota archaeon]
MKKIVLPGELVSIEQKRMGEHVFSQNDKIFADVLGIAHMDGPVAYVVPLRGRYTPKTDDLIVGIVAQTLHNGWLVNINAFYLAFVSNKEVRDNLQVGSILSAKIMDVSETKDVSIGFVRMFYGGEG